MVFNNKEIEFPAILQVSFFKVIESLEHLAQESDNGVSDYAKQILFEVEKYPELKNGFEDLSLLKKYKKPIKKLSRVLFPDTLMTNEIKALTPPFYFDPIFSSTRFDTIIESSGKNFSSLMKDLDADTFYLYCCYYILGRYYGYHLDGGGHLKIELLNKEQNIIRTYKMGVNADMSEFIPTESAVDITRADFEELIDNFGDIALWKKKFPPNSWIMRGVNMINLTDTTSDQSLAEITSNLLVKTTDTFDKIQNGVRNLLNNSKLKIGILTMNNEKIVPLNKEGVHSILLQAEESMDCSKEMCEYSINKLLEDKEPLVITDVDRFHEKSNSYLSKKLVSTGFKSYILAPLIHEDELHGFIELAAKNRYELTKATNLKLNEVLPTLSVAHKRFMAEAQNRIEAIIQQECTTIHHSVKWRFEQEAEKFMMKQYNHEDAVFKDIIFENVYPLYGQMDIKGSSLRRNEAVKADLIEQINGVKKVLKYAFQKTKMPAYEELIFGLDTQKNELKKELSAGTEHKILDFLTSDVYPVFDYLQQSDTKTKELIANYNTLLDPELNTVYKERKKYDTNVNLINHKLSAYLDQKQQKAQEMFPHYFERYKTDGIEYNMYIGQSIAHDKMFDTIYLRNLRIWQLVVMCEMENEFKAMQNELYFPMEIASLILVYNTPLAVHFRMDEKRFDVEGAYNTRYEIIKKRIDKAHIKGTNERITQPGHIAIVYSQEQDAREYRKYLHFLAAKGYLKKEFENVELEDLQGVTGLRALRAKVSFTEALSVDELMVAIEGGSEN